jgi:hypothetical protein
MACERFYRFSGCAIISLIPSAQYFSKQILSFTALRTAKFRGMQGTMQGTRTDW